MIKIKSKKILLGIISLIILILLNIISVYLQNKEKNNIKINGDEFINIENKICVYIDGAVNNPGMYKLNKGISLEKCLDIIGGIKENADIYNIDLKEILVDKEKINIPYLRENIFDEEKIVDINNATIEELEDLPGIGKITAEKIIKYRKNNKFKNIEEIMNVNGISQNKFNQIKEYIIVD